MRYKILHDNDTERLTPMVQSYLDKGWTPLGGLLIVQNVHEGANRTVYSVEFYQVVVGEIK